MLQLVCRQLVLSGELFHLVTQNRDILVSFLGECSHAAAQLLDLLIACLNLLLQLLQLLALPLAAVAALFELLLQLVCFLDLLCVRPLLLLERLSEVIVILLQL